MPLNRRCAYLFVEDLSLTYTLHMYFIYKCFQVKHLLETNMEKGMLNYNETGYDGVTHTWDIIQTEVGVDI